MDSPVDIEVPVPWGHISGKWWGPREKQPVLALHGWQDNAGTFDNLAKMLPPDTSLLCIDLPGHGMSSHFPQGQFYYIWWDSLLVVRRVVKYFNWKTVSILGHSLGGGVGFLYAASYPDEVQKLISIDIVCPRIEPPSKLVMQTPVIIDRFLKYETLTPDSIPSYDYHQMLDIVEDAYKGSVSKEGCNVLMQRGIKASGKKQGCFHFARDPRLKIAGLAMFSKDLVLAYAEHIQCEYLNIRAKSGFEFPLPQLYDEVLDIIKRKASRFEYHEVPGTHHVHLNNPENIVKIISDFLSSSYVDVSANHDDLII